MANVRQLMIFRAVMRLGTVSAAARMMHLTQPAVTKALRHVEEDVGIALFLRIGGRLKPTPEAELFLQEVERLHGSIEAIDSLAAGMREGTVGRIAIAAASTLALSLIAPALGRIRNDHPGVEFDLRSYATKEVVDQVRDGHAELGIIDVFVDEPELQAIEFGEGEVICAMTSDHRLAGQKFIGADQLAGEPLILFGPETRIGLSAREALELERPVIPAATVNQSAVACALAREKLGIALINSFFVLRSRMFPDLVYSPLRPRIALHPRILARRGRPLSRTATHLVTLLQTALG